MSSISDFSMIKLNFLVNDTTLFLIACQSPLTMNNSMSFFLFNAFKTNEMFCLLIMI